MKSVGEFFHNTVCAHKMNVLLDNGVFRCIDYSAPLTRANSFTLTTWPGHLCISGDRGTWVFSRLHDMFDFFRGDRVNVHYWAEKIVASDRHAPRSDGTRFDFAETKKDVLAQCELEDLREDVDATFASTDENDVRVYDALSDLGFHDVHELLCYTPTVNFVVCLHAIVWGIAQYDARSS